MGYNGDNTTESGIYYIVPDRNGKPGSKRIVQRPRPPLTSVPLDEDFDAITRTTMYTGKGRYSWVPTQPPLDDEFDAITYTNTNTNFEKIDEVDEELEEIEETEGGRDTITRMVREEEDDDDDRITQNTRRVETGINRKLDVFQRYRRASTSRVDDYTYRNHRSHLRAESRVLQSPTTQNARHHPQTRPSDDFASRYIPQRDRTPRPTYTSGDAERSQLVRSTSRRSSNRNCSQLPPHDRTQNDKRSNVYRSEEMVRHNGDYQRAPSTPRRRRDSGVSVRSRSRSRSRARNTTKPHSKAISTTPHVRPPGRQQSYEVIKSRVLEDTPEKTVTISTWRERVAEANGVGRDGNAEEETRMSVYYIDADDYPVEDQGGRVIELEQRVLERGDGGVEWMGSKSPRMVPKRTLSNGGSRKGKERERFPESENRVEKPQISKTDFRDRVLTPWPSMSELGDIDEELQEEEDDEVGKQLTHRRSQSLPVDLEWQDPDEPGPIYDKSANITHPRTSTPVRDLSGSRPKPPKSVSLIPTRSNGSSISSIHAPLSGTPRPSTSTQPSSIHPPPHEPRSVAEILTACKPSLMHLEPILYELGIRTEDHFKAVGKMSEATRDREIKKIAVQKGVTVFEWAMLIDKMQNL